MVKQRTSRREMRKIEIELKDVTSSDVRDFGSWSPALEDVYFPVHLSIGERGKAGADLFQCLIATPEGLRKAQSKLIIEDRALVVVDRYEWPQILKELETIIYGIAAIDWLDASQKLQRYFVWEYEDMEWHELG